jgi:predicted RNA methylase
MTDSHIAKDLRKLVVPVSSLHPDPSNARKHGQRNLDAIKASLAAFGQRKPLVVQREGMIVRAGNGTLAAAQALGWDHIAAVVIDEDSAQAVQFAIADNRTAELAEWDDETLATLLDGMDEPTRDMLAFDDKELAGLMRGLEPEEIVEDEAPEPPSNPVTQLGDLWKLGRHRILCGDSTKSDDVKTVTAGSQIDAVITDPPYGTGITADRGLGNSNVPMALAGDQDNALAIQAFKVWGDQAPLQIWWGANYYASALPNRKCWVVWDKDHHGMTYADAELAWTNQDSPVRVFRHAWSGMHRASERQTEKQHPTQKPVALFAWLIKQYGDACKAFADPFLGSGSSLMAAEQTGRTCLGIEIDPAYCDVIVERWEKLTGQKAVRNG